MKTIRRRCCTECGTVIDSGEAQLICGPLRLDRALRYTTWRGFDVHLTAQEFEVLELLVQREGRLVASHAFFNAEIFDEETDDKIVDVIVCKLRARFKAVDPEFNALVTHWGEGYRWKRIEAPAPVIIDQLEALRERARRSA